MEKRNIITWFKRVGVIGFMFFLLKGLAWLAVFYFAGKAVVD